MSNYNKYVPDGWVPDGWVMVYYPKLSMYKLFCSWSGGYLGSDSWRLNSSVRSVELDEHNNYVVNKDKSCYVLSQHGYGRINAYNSGVLASFQDHHKLDVLVEAEAKSILENKIDSI